MKEVKTFYELADGGALLVVFAFTMWALYHSLTKLAPALRALQKTVELNHVTAEKLLDGNASALREFSASNNNVARALDLLTKQMEKQDMALERHEALSQQNFKQAFDKQDDMSKAMDSIRTDLTKHVSACDNRYFRHHP